MMQHDKSPKRRKKKVVDLTKFNIKCSLRDRADIVWSPGSDRLPQKANLAWYSRNPTQSQQILCKVGCRCAFLFVSMEFNTEFHSWFEPWRSGALRGSTWPLSCTYLSAERFSAVLGAVFFSPFGRFIALHHCPILSIGCVTTWWFSMRCRE